MGGLIGLLIKGALALVLFSVYALWKLARLTVLASAYVVKVTAQLLSQRKGGQVSPDNRYWWNGQQWVPKLPSAMWIVPGGAVAVLLLVTGVCTASLATAPNSGPGGTVADTRAAPTNSPTPSFAAQPSPTPHVSIPPARKPAPKPSPKPRTIPPTTRPAPPPNTCGAPANPFGYDFCLPASLIYSPPSSFCAYFNCIRSFSKSTNGYVDECSDGTYSHSGGRQGACSYHGGELRPLYS